MQFRKIVEVLFAHLKRILGLGRPRLGGPCGANEEFFLAATAQNLRKLANIFPVSSYRAKPEKKGANLLFMQLPSANSKHIAFPQRAYFVEKLFLDRGVSR